MQRIYIPGRYSGKVVAISGDGLMVVGDGASSKSFLWTRSEGAEFLGVSSSYRPTKIDPFPRTSVADISLDGSTVLGWKSIGKLPDGYSSSRVRALSADGSTIVGSFSGEFLTGREALRWTRWRGFVGRQLSPRRPPAAFL